MISGSSSPVFLSFPNSTTLWRFLITADGSPTLEFQYPHGRIEKMHHSQGAFSESLYIYLEAINLACIHSPAQNFLSVGLGLAYNEILLAGKLLHLYQQRSPLNINPEEYWKYIYLESYECEWDLKIALCHWLEIDFIKALNPAPEFKINSPSAQLLNRFKLAYDTLLHMTAQHFDLCPQNIKNLLGYWLKRRQWYLCHEFNPTVKPTSQFHCIFYDPFSSQTHPDLWAESALGTVIAHWAAPQCTISTYAATGNLKRVLKEQSFIVSRNSGFGGKRHSTLAYR